MSRSLSAEQVAEASRRVERVYGVLARVYDDSFDWALGPGRRHVVRSLSLSGGDNVLEVGVGTGLSLPLYPADCSVTGIDISEAMLERAQARTQDLRGADLVLRRMDAQNLNFRDESFDYVLAPYVISVVPDPIRVMSEMRRVCRVGGTVVVLNQFRSHNPVLGLLDRGLTPLTQWLGFRMDLPIETVTETAGLEVVRVERVNLLGLWHLVEMRRTA